MASTLYISLPPRGVAQSRPDWLTTPLSFALYSAEGQLMQQGQQTLAQLRSLADGARQLSLLLAASDVSLLSVAVPPMTAAKLKQALPNLIEEQLSSDPADAAMVAGEVSDGKVQVAVTDRAWLETAANLVKDWNVRKITAFPAQLLLEAAPAMDAASAAFETADGYTEISLRKGVLDGAGLSLADTSTEGALRMLNLIAGGTALHVLVPAQELQAVQSIAQSTGLGANWSFAALNWSSRLASVSARVPDLMLDISALHKPAIDWAAWRWPLGLAAAVVLVNITALNFEWFTLKREAKAMNDAIVQTYRSSFPKDTLSSDLPKQMEQKLDQARRLSGQFAQNDFAIMDAQFAQVWDRVMAGKGAAITYVEFKDHVLHVKLKSVSGVPVEELRQALAEQALKMEAGSDGVLHISAGGKK
ncbi:MAG: type II secretion system protein GspL [Undibacterium curvum]|uniref:type II secretion system protein GspL n=1 Tax=Undibacterium curvum TaxID=2762294 RepID=UPI003BE40BBA